MDPCCVGGGAEDLGVRPAQEMCLANEKCTFKESCTVKEDNCALEFAQSAEESGNSMAVCGKGCQFQPSTHYLALTTVNGPGFCINQTAAELCAQSEGSCDSDVCIQKS
ncbi:unnamed protein product, partial [Ostreobium quekettii]